MYGHLEEHYSRARHAGVLFLRYEEDRKPVVNEKDGNLELSFLQSRPAGGYDVATPICWSFPPRFSLPTPRNCPKCSSVRGPRTGSSLKRI